MMSSLFRTTSNIVIVQLYMDILMHILSSIKSCILFVQYCDQLDIQFDYHGWMIDIRFISICTIVQAPRIRVACSSHWVWEGISGSPQVMSIFALATSRSLEGNELILPDLPRV